MTILERRLRALEQRDRAAAHDRGIDHRALLLARLERLTAHGTRPALVATRDEVRGLLEWVTVGRRGVPRGMREEIARLLTDAEALGRAGYASQAHVVAWALAPHATTA